MKKNIDQKNVRNENTKLVQLGRDPQSHEGFVNPPIQRGSTILFDKADMVHGDHKTYGLEGASTQDRLCEALSEIAGGIGTILCPSGLSAITLVLLSAVKSGDHLLVTDSAYGPARRFCDDVLAGFGVETSYYDPRIGAGIEELIRPNTKLILLESPGSLTLEFQDVPAIVAIAKKHGVATAIDDTWSAGIFLKPLMMGVDISIQALTKYQSGHSDVLAGSITTNNPAWLKKLQASHVNYGIGTSAEDAWLCLRGLRTMGVRMKHQDLTARKIAAWLETRPEVAKVLHPALESSQDHAIWKRDFTGAAGLFGFILKPEYTKSVNAMLESLEIFGMGFSWGGYESLALHCNHFTRTAKQWNVNAPLIRISIGLEDEQDLIKDLERGFAALNK